MATSRPERALARLHLISVLVAEQVQQTVDERGAPAVADDLWAEDDVAEHARYPCRQLVPAVDREGEDVRDLVDAEVRPLQRLDLVRPDEREPHLALLDPLRGEHLPRECDDPRRVDRGAAPVGHLDLDHDVYLRRAVPVSSAWRL